ncbi:hypothetical protein DFH01_21445 [Falsiroseomonas bella]|uniref:DUF3618 domain-containing protein n=1 Tax=Falsiroseomonas bella TaxID=2184016 RepID=A0A317F913_9PROT|nr:DUF3618 domain-containing protein [Falsiroseomonas bella]PWS34913.1 hypothetical protein DFH01_21445 [Falsiroseomonas bella]
MSSTRSTTNPGDRSAAEIEREVEQTRARLTGTVEELKDRVSPGTLADQAMDWLRGSGGRQFLDNLGGTLRDNPVPVVLVAAGIGWLALSGRGGPRRSRRWYDDDDRYTEDTGYDAGYPVGAGAYPGESYPPETYAGQPGTEADGGPSLGERAGEAAEGLRRRAAGLGHSAASRAAGLRDRAGDLAGRVGEAADEAWHGATGAARSAAAGASHAGRQVAHGAGRAWDAASDTASDLGRGAYRLGEGAGRRMSAAVEEQPLLLGAFGLAIGATMGALMPATEAEDRLMGETRDRMADRLSGLAGEAYERAKETAGEQAQRAGEQLGAVARDGAQALGDVARDLRETVERTAHDAAATAREAADKAREKAEKAGPGASGGTATGPASTPGSTPGTTSGTTTGTGTATPGSTGVTPGASPGSVGGSPSTTRIGPV